ncbi:serine hydrolase [Microbacterium lushaniae]|uniref:Serine hydrolase n=1 Tax=Microbacterium lushaniae TaxID=2614639 RepID=A0A5J6L356_9MICO|nr:serine hydrolase [Microbacterium lushaniae]QEW02920.1 serine hydrolase [Microbacterium lushaniae]
MTRRLRIGDLAALTIPSQPALSPDGARIAYVLGGVDTQDDRSVSSLWLAERDAAPRRLTRGLADAAPVFSPDGQTLAFLREGQVWTLPLAGGDAQQRTSLPLGAGPAVWSPDGATIVFAAPVDLLADEDESDEDRAARESSPIVTDGAGYQADGMGFLRGIRTQLHALDVASGEVRQLTDADAFASGPAWSPDGTRLAYVAKPAGVDDLTYRSAVHVLDPADPAAPPAIVAFEGGAAATVAYAPDGRMVVAGWPGEPTGIARLYRVDPATGEAVELAAALDRNIMPGGPGYPGGLPQVSTAGDVVFAARDRGCTHVYAVALEGGEPRLVHGGDAHVVSGLAVAGDDAAIVLATATSFGEIVRIDLASGDEQVVTDHGAALGDVELFVRESREFAISDGVTVQGWILRDPARTGPAPLLVDVHGGPHNAWNGAVDDMHLYHQELVSRGWSVLMLNPRGSDGYGEEFFTAVNGRWGEVDAKDFLEPVDQLVAEGTADPKRLALTGYSYGGFMTCYLTSRDDRFAAAVAGGVVSDLTSMGGTADEAHLLNVFEVAAMPWDPRDRDRIAAMNPYAQVDRVQTPTLVLHGGADVRCPVGQAEQWHLALRERGVPTRLVLYPGGSHLFPLAGRPSHRIDYNTRVVEWVEQYAADAAGPRPATIDAARWQRRLVALAKRHKVPGAQLGILRLGDGRADDVVVAAHGTLNKNLETAPVTKDSIFQIGSISKVWTASVIMRLVDEGRLTLETKVKDVLPGFRLSEDELTDGVTIRHLLTHTSGLDGDVFTDTGRGDDCIQKYVDLLDTAGKNHPLGATWSYCNSGYSVLGRIIEVLTGKTWDAAMSELLYEPLDLTHTVTLPEDAILHGAAVGHVEVAGEQIVTPAWLLPRGIGPAGLITSRAEDVLAFARLHMTGGVTAGGERILSEDVVAQMQAFQAEVPDKHVLGDSWGLGWIRFDWNGDRLYGHDGNTLGQAAFLRIHPESGVAVTLLTNGGHTRDLYEELYREIFAELSGLDMSHPVTIPAEPVEVDLTPFVGTYERASVRMEIFAGEDGPRLRTTMLGPLAELEPHTVEEYPLVALDDHLFALRAPGTQTWMTLTFYSLPTGEEYLHFGARATPKVSDRVPAPGAQASADAAAEPAEKVDVPA